MEEEFKKIGNFVLGEKVKYKCTYDKSLLVFVPREPKRVDIGYVSNIKTSFKGFDLWNCYELSYLDWNGKPHAKIGILTYNCDTENIVESKSLKLYLNSFNMQKFKGDKHLRTVVESDLMEGLNDPKLKFRVLDLDDDFKVQTESGYHNLDKLDVKISEYTVDKNILKSHNTEDTTPIEVISFKSGLLKSNCLVTGQPDWGSVFIQYVPDEKYVDEVSLLKYIISFRMHNEFHEQCIERIYQDLMTLLKPRSLEVFGKYVRRGGIDINPYRIFDPENHIRHIDFRTKMEKEAFHRESKQ